MLHQPRESPAVCLTTVTTVLLRRDHLKIMQSRRAPRVPKTCFTPLILRCFLATILHPYHPQPLEPLTPQIHRAARSCSPSHHPIVQKYRHYFLSFSRSPQRAAPADRKRLIASRTGSDCKAALASIDQGARTGGAPHQELPAGPLPSAWCRHANSYQIIQDIVKRRFSGSTPCAAATANPRGNGRPPRAARET